MKEVTIPESTGTEMPLNGSKTMISRDLMNLPPIQLPENGYKSV
jgi:MFS family permease